MEGSSTVRCVGGVVHDAVGRLLLVLRAHPPSAGLWSLPGGRVESGESDTAAVVRELREETGLRVTPHTLLGSVRRGQYEIHDYLCSALPGEPHAGDDAAEVRWVSADAFEELDRTRALTDGLSATLRAWGTVPR